MNGTTQNVKIYFPTLILSQNDRDIAVRLEADAAHFLVGRRGDLQIAANSDPAQLAVLLRLSLERLLLGDERVGLHQRRCSQALRDCLLLLLRRVLAALQTWPTAGSDRQNVFVETGGAARRSPLQSRRESQ